MVYSVEFIILFQIHFDKKSRNDPLMNELSMSLVITRAIHKVQKLNQPTTKYAQEEPNILKQ